MSNVFDNSWEPKVYVWQCFTQFQCFILSWRFTLFDSVIHMSDVTFHMSNAYVDPWACWTTFVFMCKLKSDCLSRCHISPVICQMLMLILGTCWTIFVFMCKVTVCHAVTKRAHSCHVDIDTRMFPNKKVVLEMTADASEPVPGTSFGCAQVSDDFRSLKMLKSSQTAHS